MMFFASELKNSETRVARMAKMSARAKAAAALLEFKNVFGYKPGRAHVVDVPVGRNDLCALSLMRYETLSRMLSEFSRKHWARHQGETLEIFNEKALEEALFSPPTGTGHAQKQFRGGAGQGGERAFGRHP